MISSLRGRAIHVDTDQVVIDVGGVGFSVAVPTHLAISTGVGDEIALHTNLIVREDALSLFGFESRAELVVFTQLLGVTGVGPKSALGIVSSLGVHQIADAVAGDDDAPFRRVTGIGPKTAKLIVVQLTGKLAPPAPGGGAARPVASSDIATQVTQALIGLGWTDRAAAEAVASSLDGASERERSSVPLLLRLTLATLGPARKEHARG